MYLGATLFIMLLFILPTDFGYVCKNKKESLSDCVFITKRTYMGEYE